MASSHVRIASLDDIMAPDASNNRQELRMLVTVHSFKPFYGGIYEKGLGMWVAYILQKYLKQRRRAHRLYIKSVVTEGRGKTKPQTVVDFIRRNSITVWIPSDVTDTLFIAQHYDSFQGLLCNFAVTPDPRIYQMLEHKWEMYNFCLRHNIPMPTTELFLHTNKDMMTYPFYLKVASGTNAGRGVWLCKNRQDLKKALKSKRAARGVVLVTQKPLYGQLVCAEVIYNLGYPVGWYFSKSVQPDNLVEIGKRYIFSRSKKYRERCSHVKVVLDDSQWKTLTDMLLLIGRVTNYHGMLDIDFIIASDDNEGIQEGSVWLLEFNPRFSGAIHTTLSNPGFLDAYMDLVEGKCRTSESMTNFSAGVEMKSQVRLFHPATFYAKHPLKVLCIRHWRVNNSHAYSPR